jgi:hypothetical protein
MAAQVVEIADTVREGKKVKVSQKDGTTEERGDQVESPRARQGDFLDEKHGPVVSDAIYPRRGPSCTVWIENKSLPARPFLSVCVICLSSDLMQPPTPCNFPVLRGSQGRNEVPVW